MYQQIRHLSTYSKSIDSSLRGPAYIRSAEKQHLDYYGSRILRPLAAPVIASARAAIWLYDRGPTEVSLPRVGRDGEMFDEYKLRSMVLGTERTVRAPRIRDRKDPCITPVGGVIRPLSIDELAQLKNVRQGSMSLVGPRPKSMVEFIMLSEIDPDFAPAYTIGLPGITGLEQIRGRAHVGIAERIDYIKEYAEEACLALDRHILMQTALVVVARHGAY